MLPLVVMVAGSLRPAGLPPPVRVDLIPSSPTLEAYRRLPQLVPVWTWLRNSTILVALAVPISVRGYVEQTPIQVREFYQQAQGLELFEIEDEVYEAEALFAGPKFRSYVKAQAQCQQGSVLIVYVGPGEGALPSVGGG